MLQGLHALKDPTGWTVARDDELKVMYQHHAGNYLCQLFTILVDSMLCS